MPAPGLQDHHSALNRWVHLVGGVLAMMALADAQFVACALARLPEAAPGEAATAIRNALGAFLIAETLFVPIERQLLDEASPVVLTGAGAGLTVVSWLLSSEAGGHGLLLLWTAVGGLGAGLFYAGTVARSLVRFTEHRGRCLLGVAATCVAAIAPVLPVMGRLRAGPLPDLLPWSVAQAAVVVMATIYVVKPLPPGWEQPDE
jgi:hypothetical protein